MPDSRLTIKRSSIMYYNFSTFSHGKSRSFPSQYRLTISIFAESSVLLSLLRRISLKSTLPSCQGGHRCRENYGKETQPKETNLKLSLLSSTWFHLMQQPRQPMATYTKCNRKRKVKTSPLLVNIERKGCRSGKKVN